MHITVAVAGKGGTGKTTLAGLLIEILRQFGKSILAIDADPNTNLHQWLGIDLKQTIGSLAEKVVSEKGESALSKKEMLSLSLSQALTESSGFDFLAMGRPEGPGCYCYVNNLLRSLLDTLEKNYTYVVIDSEAGMEHISRKTTKEIDILLLTADPTYRGIITAKDISRLAQELKIGVKEEYLILNRVSGHLSIQLKGLIQKENLNLLGIVPEDPEVFKLSQEGESLKFLSSDSVARKKIERIAKHLFREL